MKRVAQFLIVITILVGLKPGVSHGQTMDPTGTPHLELNTSGHTSTVSKVLFTHDGNYVITVGYDKAIRFWSAKTDRAIGMPIYGQIGGGVEGNLICAALTDDGILAVAGETHIGSSQDANADYVVRLYRLDLTHHDSPTVRQVGLLHGLDSSIESLAFTPDGSELAAAAASGKVQLWARGGSGEAFHASGDPLDCGKTVLSLAFSPNGTQLACAGVDHNLKVWDTLQRTVKTLGKHGGPIGWVVWTQRSTDHANILATSSGDSIYLWNSDNGRRISEISLNGYAARCLAFSSHGDRLACGVDDQSSSSRHSDYKVKEWQVAGDSAQEIALPISYDLPVMTVAFSPDDAVLASAGGSRNTIRLADASTGTTLYTLTGAGDTITTLIWSADGQYLGVKHKNSADKAATDFVYNVENPNNSTATYSGVWSAADPISHSTTLVLSDDKRSVRIMDGTRQVSQFAAVPSDETFDAAQCALWTGKNYLAVGTRFALNIYDDMGKQIGTCLGHSGPIRALAVSPDGKYLASASEDQTVSIWPLASMNGTGASPLSIKPLETIFPATNGEWVAWTPDGYYTCSPAGDEMIGWQTNAGDDQIADYDLASRYQGFYQPSLMSYLLTEGSVSAARIRANVDARSLQASRPPLIESLIVKDAQGNELRNSVVFTGKSVFVTAHIVDPSKGKITQVRVTRNGTDQTATSTDQSLGMTDVTWSQTVKLVPGENNIVLTAGNEAESSSKPQHFNITSNQPPHAPSLYMLSIGIGEYFGGDTYQLLYPARDASDLADFFAGQEGVFYAKGGVAIDRLTDRQASKDAILSHLAKIRTATADFDDKDTIIIFLAGHGWQDKKVADDTGFYFIPQSVNPRTSETVRQTAVQWSSIAKNISGLSGTVVLILDACDSKGVTGGLSTYFTREHNRQIDNQSNIIGFVSCGPDEQSFESPTLEHGIFSYVLLKGLQGAAADKNGYVTASGLQDYLGREVPSLSERAIASVKDAFPNEKVGIQHPYCGVGLFNDRPLARVKSPATPVVSTTSDVAPSSSATQLAERVR